MVRHLLQAKAATVGMVLLLHQIMVGAGVVVLVVVGQTEQVQLEVMEV
jgi:hypothetical protein